MLLSMTDPAGTVDKTKVTYEGPTYADKVGGIT